MARKDDISANIDRRAILSGAAALPAVAVAASVPAKASEIDPAVRAAAIATNAETVSLEAYRAADGPTVVQVGDRYAGTNAEIDRLISQYRNRRIFARGQWPEGSRTPEQQARDRIEREATAAPVPDAEALKAELRELKRHHAEATERHRVDETREAFFEAQQNLIDTPATTIEGVVAKLRFAVGLDAKPDPDDAESMLIHGAIADAERLAAKGAV